VWQILSNEHEEAGHHEDATFILRLPLQEVLILQEVWDARLTEKPLAAHYVIAVTPHHITPPRIPSS